MAATDSLEEYVLADIDDRVDRAEEHLEPIKIGLRDYFNSDSYRFVGKFDPDIGVQFTGGANPPPVILSTLTGEMLHDLKSALDHLACEFVRRHGGQTNQRTMFPLCKAFPTPDKDGVRPPLEIANEVSAAAYALIERAQPAQYGADYATHPLWFLQRMAIVDRHRKIAISGVWLQNIAFNGVAWETWGVCRGSG